MIAKRTISRRETYGALLFVLPAYIFFFLFVLIPIVRTTILSFTDWSGFSEQIEFLGLSNYAVVLQDARFYKAVLRSLYFTSVHMIAGAGLGLIFAVLIGQVKWGRNLFRAVFFFPNMLSIAVVGVTWAQFYHPKIGLINQFLKTIGLGFLATPWLGNAATALPAVSIASAWGAYGFYMIIFIAAIQLIDKQLYEAAIMDGANTWKQFWHITIPGLYNTISIVLILSFINGLKGFGSVWAMTQGGPVDATELVMVYIWRDAFQSGGQLSVSLAASILFGLFIVVISAFFNHFRDKKRV